MEKLLQLLIMNKNEMKSILKFKLEKNDISTDVIEACNVLIIQYPVDIEGFQNI